MENNVNSLKCLQCHLVNFANAEACKRCGAPLLKRDSQVAPELSSSTQGEPQDQVKNEESATQARSLLPCPDCEHLCSRLAEACPNCGRLLRDRPIANKRSLKKVVAIGAAAFCLIAIIGVVSTVVIFQRRAVAAVAAANHESGLAALKAVLEIQSVTSVGSTYPQYTAAIQSAKIKFDAAMRDYVVSDEKDKEIPIKLAEAFDNYKDAGDAWAEFIQHGDQFGFISESNSVIAPLAAQYGFVTTKFSTTEPHFYKDESVQAIWKKAHQNTTAITMLLGPKAN